MKFLSENDYHYNIMFVQDYLLVKKTNYRLGIDPTPLEAYRKERLFLDDLILL